MSHTDALHLPPGIRRYFQVQRFCFTRIGINVISSKRLICNHFMAWIPMLLEASSCLPMFLYAIQNLNDLDKVTDSLSPFWQSILALFKFVYFLRNNKKIIKLIRKLWLWNLEAKGEELVILAEENRKDIIFCNFYHMSVASSGIMALLSPLVFASFYAWNGMAFLEYLEPPLKGYYIIDKIAIFGYIIVFVWNVGAVYFIIYSSLAIDSLYSWLMCNIVAQFRILKYRVRQAGEQNDGDCSLQTIRECIAYHCRVIKLANDFNDAFRVVVFVKFAISCLQICCLAFQFSRGGELFDQVFHGLFLLSVSLQLILYCYGGQRIQDESNSITNEIYESFHWGSLKLANKKMLIFPMMRSQVSCNVSGIFFTANLSLFLWVYRTAASLITLLWTLEEKEEGL